MCCKFTFIEVFMRYYSFLMYFCSPILKVLFILHPWKVKKFKSSMLTSHM